MGFGTSILSLGEPPPSKETETLDAIGNAFFRALDNPAGAFATYGFWFVALVSLGVVVRWLRREAAVERREQELLNAEREEALKGLRSVSQKREWVRVPARLPISRRVTGTRGKTHVETAETRDLSAGGVSFLSRHPPALGDRLHVDVELGDRTTVSLAGLVVRVEPPSSESRDTSVVALRLVLVEPTVRQQLMKWVTHEENRQIAQAQRERVCPRCGNPLAKDAGAMHASCRPSTIPRPT